MFSVKIGRVFEIEVVGGGVYLLMGRRSFYWSREDGLVTDRVRKLAF